MTVFRLFSNDSFSDDGFGFLSMCDMTNFICHEIFQKKNYNNAGIKLEGDFTKCSAHKYRTRALANRGYYCF